MASYLNFKAIVKLSVIMLFVSIFACTYDQTVSNYENYQDALENDFFKKGWIPKAVQYESMKNIYNKNNLDSNNSIFSFELNQRDLKKLLKKVEQTDSKFKNIHDIAEPEDWIEEISKLKNYKSSLFKQNIAVDEVNKKVYGWTNE